MYNSAPIKEMKNVFAMKHYLFTMAFASIGAACLCSCRNDSLTETTLSLDEFTEKSIENEHKWEGAPDNQIIGAIYSQPGQYVVFMPMDSCRVWFYDLNMNFMYRRASAGQGPGEFIDPLYCGQWIQNDTAGIETAILDTPTERIMVVSDKFEGAKEIASLPKDLGLSPVFMIPDSGSDVLYGVSSYNSCELGQGVMFRYDTVSDSLIYSSPSFQIEDRKSSFYLMQKAIAASHDCKHFVNAYLYEPAIELWNGELELIKKMKLKDAGLVGRFDEDNYNSNMSYFRCAQIDEKYIYVMYYGRTYRHPGDSYLLVFDHSGAPVCKINIGESYWFTVNISERTIITLKLSAEEEPEVYIASLPDTL